MKIKSEQEHLPLLEANQIWQSKIYMLKSQEQTKQIPQQQDAATLGNEENCV